ncbi:MAG TPA: VWA domain-containing protein [Pyrinomonadaceae bacterium]|jgi:VWFA-related protein
MLKPGAFALFLILALLCTPLSSASQQKKNVDPNRQKEPAVSAPAKIEDAPVVEPQEDGEVVKVDTSLVSIPVVVSDRAGVYVPDMSKEEFTLTEDGVRQELAFFSTVSQPFTVILMLDTSASTEEKLRDIRRAANAFVSGLQPQDRIKVMSFDDEVRDLNPFTSDHAIVERAIQATRAGKGTKLYDAMQTALSLLKPDKARRKAVVIFTDGVDYRSDSFRYINNIRALEESGVIVYPIRYDTRIETERIAREQAAGGGRPDLAAIIKGRGDGRSLPIPTGTTFPGGTIPSGRGDGQPTIGGIPIPTIPAPPRRDDDPRQTRRDDPRLPRSPGEVSAPGTSHEDGIGMMLNSLYKTADSYLNELAQKSGGKLTRADTLERLPAAFKEIAAELRTQYAIGYYPSNPVKNGSYRKIKITSTRKGANVRARPGYSAVSVP